MKISVLTPCFNSGQYLKKCIESVLSQTYLNWEHIIVDGNSTDNTIEILEQYPHLIWISEPDSGQSEAMNKAFAMSKGDLIVYLNADDYFFKDSFRIFIDSFKKHSNTDIIVGNLYVENNNKLTPSVNSTTSWKDLSILKGRFPMNPVSYMYKKKVQEGVGAFPIDEHYTMDYWFLIRAFYLFEVVKIDDFLGCFVFVENNKSSIVSGEFQVQMPHAIKFCKENTPQRILYVAIKLLFHPKNPSSIIKRILNIEKRSKRKLKKYLAILK